MRKILLKNRQLGKNNLISYAAEVLAWTLGWKPDTHCIEEIPLILYTYIHWDAGLENKIDISLDLWIHLPKKTFPSLSHPRKAIAVRRPSLTWSYLQGRPQGPRCFPEATSRCPAQLGFLTNALVDHSEFKHHLVMTALLEFPEILVYKCLPKSEKICEKIEDLIPNNPPYAYDTGSPHKRNDSRWQLIGPHIRSAENR